MKIFEGDYDLKRARLDQAFTVTKGPSMVEYAYFFRNPWFVAAGAPKNTHETAVWFNLRCVPSIVIGIFAYTIIVIRINFSTLGGGVALGVMMIPIALRSTEEFLRSVPVPLREGAMALGATKSRTIATVVVPAAIRGVISGTMLNLARVAGETAPLFVYRARKPILEPGLEASTATLPAMIYEYAKAPYEDWHRQAWAAGFMLLTLVLLLNVTARSIIAGGFSHKRR